MNKNLLTDAQALIPLVKRNRRDFLRVATSVGISSGFALAAQPVLSQAIKTDFEGIDSQEIMFTSAQAQIPAYMSKPKDTTNKLPVIIIASEIFGVHEYIADVTRRLAKQGYMAIAPEFFTRAGDPTELGTVAEIMEKIVSITSDKQVMQDIEAAIDWAGKNGGDIARVGITGFCWGGRITWLACENIKAIRAGVAWYGRLLGDKNSNTPEHPIDLVSRLSAPVLGLYGAQDTGIPVSSINEMKKALASVKANNAAKESKFEIYPDAPHAFHADYRESYRAGPAQDGWNQLLKWFSTHGV